jgi:hypothetical protein
MASRLPFPKGKTMPRTTPLLIVLMLLGNSGAALACELWCFNPATQRHHEADGCHEASIPVSPDQQLVPTTAGCHSPALAAFVGQARPTHLRLTTVTASSAGSVSLVPERTGRTEGWGVFNLSLSPPQASRTILRI